MVREVAEMFPLNPIPMVEMDVGQLLHLLSTIKRNSDFVSASTSVGRSLSYRDIFVEDPLPLARIGDFVILGINRLSVERRDWEAEDHVLARRHV